MNQNNIKHKIPSNIKDTENYIRLKNFLSSENYKDLNVTIRKKNKIGRNEPCPCGSGKKFKKCCRKM